jgi:hypothetical protein
MRWFRSGVGALALMVVPGCPTEFGKEGRVAKAVHQDSLEIVRKVCSEQERERVCAGSKRNSEDCRACGG